ncbi:MAG: TonB family protein [Pseudanabaenaceae cyanobacterium]
MAGSEFIEGSIEVGRRLSANRWRRSLLYASAISVSTHLLLLNSSIRLPTAGQLIDIKNEQAIDLVVMETPPAVVPQPEPVPTPESIPHQPAPSIPTAKSPVHGPSVSLPRVAPTAPLQSAELASEESTAPPVPVAPTPATGNGNSDLAVVGDRIRTLLEGSGQPRETPSEPVSAGSRVQCVRCDKPEYPAEARNRGLQGQARIAVDVDSQGQVVNVHLVESSGHPELDRAAVEQARRWQFTPSESGKQGITGRVNFRLEDGTQPRTEPKPEPSLPTETSTETKPVLSAPIEARTELKPVPIAPNPTGTEAKPVSSAPVEPRIETKPEPAEEP